MEIPHFEIHFDKQAKEVDENQFKTFKDNFNQNRYTDLIVLAHGWNNNIEEARDLYTGLLEKISEAIAARNDNSKRFASLNIFWPSKKFTDRELIPGNAAGTGDAEEQETADLAAAWSDMSALFGEGPTAESYQKILTGIRENADEDALAPHFQKILSSLISTEENSPFESLSIDEVKKFIGDGSVPYIDSGSEDGGAASTGAQLQEDGYALNLFSGIKQGIANIMNLTTYYKMKNRSGEIGTALNSKLAEIKAFSGGMNLHLIGHSFGARLVTSALLGPEKIEVKTLGLLQAAFSHYAFASQYDTINDGYFRKILTENKIKGALLITHTRADRAVGLAYALASRLAGQTASAIGDRDSLYGGLGGNGAQKTPGINDTIDLGKAATSNLFQAGKTYNLLSDNIIGGHSDIIKKEVGQTLANAFFL